MIGRLLDTLVVRITADISDFRARMIEAAQLADRLGDHISDSLGRHVDLGDLINAGITAPLALASVQAARTARDIQREGRAVQGAVAGMAVAGALWDENLFGRPRRRIGHGAESDDLRRAAGPTIDADPTASDARGARQEARLRRGVGGAAADLGEQAGRAAGNAARGVGRWADMIARWGREIGQAGATVIGLGWLGRLLAGGAVEAGIGGGLAAATTGVGGLSAAVAALGGPITIAVAAIAALIALFVAANWDDFRQFVDWFSGEAATQLGEAWGDIVSGATDFADAFMELIREVFGMESGDAAALLIGFAQLILRTFNAIGEVLGGALQILADGLRMWTALARGDWEGFWREAGDIVTTALRTISEVFLSFFPEMRGQWDAFWRQVGEIVTSRFGAVVDYIRQQTERIGDFFRELWDRVVGHSYVPDMVDGIADEFARLDAVMVEPAKSACQETADAFAALGEAASDSVAGVARAANDNAGQVSQLGEIIGSNVQSFLQRIVRGQRVSMRELVSNILVGVGDAIIRSLANDISRMVTNIGRGGGVTGKGGGGGLFSSILNGISSLFSGFFAEGGFIPPGRWGVAGEAGAEAVFGGRTGATIVPAGGGGFTYVDQRKFDMRGASVEAVVRLERMIANDRARLDGRIAAKFGDMRQRGRV